MPDIQDENQRLRAQARECIESGRLTDAVQIFSGMLESDTQDSSAAFELARLLQQLGRQSEAVAMLERTITIDPHHYAAGMILGSELWKQGKLRQAVTHYNRSLRRKRGVPINESDQSTTPHCDLSPASDDDFSSTSLHKLKHDADQLRYLVAAGRISGTYTDVALAYDQLREELASAGSSERIFSLSDEQKQRIGARYNRFIYNAPTPPLSTAGAVNPQLDGAAIERSYGKYSPGITYFDDFLTPEALQSLRRFCLESTIWYPYRYPGYTGAFLNEGFNCDLLLQISEELRRLLPNIIRDFPLRQMWAYKYDSRLEGIALHADAAAVNVNFWITPDDACLQPENSGLQVFYQEAPADWGFQRFNRDSLGIRKFLDATDNRFMTVPYKQNRVIVFHSNLFHQTDYFHFKDGYENRRINITMLFGDRG